jgi:hypothetical protein
MTTKSKIQPTFLGWLFLLSIIPLLPLLKMVYPSKFNSLREGNGSEENYNRCLWKKTDLS